MAFDCTPRVNFEVMQRFIGKKVSVVGEIESTTPEGQIVLITSDKGRIHINTNPRAGPYDTKFLEFVGNVVDPRTLQEEEHTNFGDNFDMNMYNEMVKLSNGRYADMFTS
mmetsp:Transcript_3372/g.7377  ORF Transcript_3372/g.7377 Transcript_3372/m.7377 type:complete len:110 (-) Transcript_3372:746-1075(-)|eukprot:CAMPEP_0202889772 /NCGR_PEP_ID=MMETSP1392-20130828/345_1 /ASSEMBLY_ACC=CAM_ASM_000868 /TAXON_ID=225041 /ORGANISM="Chlamydomonas chlamydogama, Strain SAG 11-48b" /LENGTH=109 /DNA_ID=CAMNT_0049573179 /DNA_START=129 /DNA_END=458 /DNA_ORIENTATION=+